jgi:hypothetical protein
VDFLTGDIGINLDGGPIGDITMGIANHVWLACEGQIYENESIFAGGAGHSVFSPVDEYDKEPFIVFRRAGLTDEQRFKIREVCDVRLGVQYSYWDCAINFFTFPLSIFPKVKRWICGELNNPFWTKCDEEVMLTLYIACKFPEFSNWGGYNPKELLDLLIRDPHWNIIYRNTPP